MTEQQDKMLERVRALLAKAEGTEYEEEAASFRAKADELMTKYAIELWQLEQAQGRTERTTPVRKDINIAWWYDPSLDYEVRYAMWQIFTAVASHARCMVVGAHTSYRALSVPVIGMPSDLGYFDMLYTHLLLQMMEAMNPSPKPGDTMIDALARMKEAGFKWEEIYNRLRRAGLVEDLGGWSKSVASKMNFAGKYTTYCRQHGRSRTYTTPSVYRRSFTEGFWMELRKRLRNQAQEQGQNTGSMAVALRDISDLVREAMWSEFPDLRPHPEDCDCDRCHECDDDKCMRPNCKAARSKRKPARMSTVVVDYDVIDRGRKAGQQVTILSDTAGLKGTTGLPS